MTLTAPFTPSIDDLRPFTAEFCLVVGIAANLLIPFATRRPNFICAVASFFTLITAATALVFQTHTIGTHLNGLLLCDSIALFWKLILLLFTAGVVVMWIGHSGRSLRQGDAPEFFTLLLGSTLGLCLMAETTNLLMIFMSLALASLPGYLLVGFRKNSKIGAEASLKYVLFGALTSAIMIYGITFLYGVYRTLQLNDLARLSPANTAQSAALTLGLIGLLIGLGFKIAAVPLHFWCPDVFEGATIEVTTFLSVASKGAALILTLRLIEIFTAGSDGTSIKFVTALVGCVTATAGNTAAFAQQNIKRLLAYSSIAQAGYMLCLVAFPGESTRPALLSYLAIYAVMNLGAFAVASVVIRTRGENLSAFAGLSRASPLLAGSLVCCLISLIGLPPFGGFGAKLSALWVLAHGGAFGITVVAVIIANTALSAFYYLRVVRAMYFDTDFSLPAAKNTASRDPIGLLIGTACAGGLFFLFFAFGPLYTAVSR